MLENPGYAVLQILEFVHARLMGPVCRMGNSRSDDPFFGSLL